MTAPADTDPETREAVARALYEASPIVRRDGTVIPWPDLEKNGGSLYFCADAVLRVLAERGMLVSPGSLVVPMLPIDPEADKLASDLIREARAKRK